MKFTHIPMIRTQSILTKAKNNKKFVKFNSPPPVTVNTAFYKSIAIAFPDIKCKYCRLPASLFILKKYLNTNSFLYAKTRKMNYSLLALCIFCRPLFVTNYAYMRLSIVNNSQLKIEILGVNPSYAKLFSQFFSYSSKSKTYIYCSSSPSLKIFKFISLAEKYGLIRILNPIIKNLAHYTRTCT